MNFKEIMKQYYAKLYKEAWIKSIVAGSIIGFLSLLVFAFFDWIYLFGMYWLGAVVFVLVTAGAAVLFFYKKYRPNRKEIAKRVDSLGLEERVLTMNQFEGDNSFIAIKQREDTMHALQKVNSKLIKITLSIPLIVLLCVSFVGSASMMTVTALSENGVIKGGKEIIDPDGPDPEDIVKTFELNYEPLGEGVIEGEVFQVVEEGQNGTPVMAIPDDGYAFVSWSDGLEDPYRIDLKVSEDMTLYAVFQMADDGAGNQTGEAGDGDGEDGDSAPEGAPQEEGQNGEGDEDGDEDGLGKGGKYEPANQVYDGETYYGGEVFENAYSDAIDRMNENGGNGDGDNKDVGNDYFKIIAK